MFEGLEPRRLAACDTTINLMIGVDGPPLVLLHGYPKPT